MALGVRNQLAVYLADLFAVGGLVLLVPDVLALIRSSGAGSSTVVADLALVAAGLLGHRVAVTALREGPVLALAALVLGSLLVVWLTGRWWVPTGAGAAAAAVAPQFLARRRAALWGGAGALLGLSGIVASPGTAVLAAAFVVAVSVVSFRLAGELRGATSRTAVDLEQALEAERLRAADLQARLTRHGEEARADARSAVGRAALTRRRGVVQAVAQAIARDLSAALGSGNPSAVPAAAERGAARAAWLAQLAAGGEARERGTTLSLVWPRVRDRLTAEVTAAHHLDASLPESLGQVVGGAEEWAQMLAALVDRAVASMPSGGVVRVRAGPGRSPAFARVTIEDTGPGIPADVLPRVLEPFPVPRPVGAPEDIGLAMVAALVEAMGGELAVTSPPGSGAAIAIEVPYYAAASGPAEALALAGAVLVADDDQDLRRKVVRLLESFGLEALDVDSGSVALAQLKAQPDRFRAAVLDVVMTGKPVSDVVGEFRELRPGFPFLLVSGLASARLVDGLLALGGVGFLHKPFTREELFYALRDLFTVGAPPPSPATPSGRPGPRAA